jgi:hypothetical protein
MLGELEGCARYGGAEVEGSGAEVGNRLEGLGDATDGAAIELGRRCDSTSACGSGWTGTGTGRGVEPIIVDIVMDFGET